jgi:general secretion pathway protein C
MQQLLFGRSARAQTVMIFLVTISALLVLVFVAAYWTWQWFAPRQEPRVPAISAVVNQAAKANDLFGLPRQAIATTTPTKPVTIRLLGIAAAHGGHEGYAVMQVAPGVVASVREGQSIAPGLKLSKVDTDHVVLERAGVAETLAWPLKNTAMAAPASQYGK